MPAPKARQSTLNRARHSVRERSRRRPARPHPRRRHRHALGHRRQGRHYQPIPTAPRSQRVPTRRHHPTAHRPHVLTPPERHRPLPVAICDHATLSSPPGAARPAKRRIQAASSTSPAQSARHPRRVSRRRTSPPHGRLCAIVHSLEVPPELPTTTGFNTLIVPAGLGRRRGPSGGSSARSTTEPNARRRCRGVITSRAGWAEVHGLQGCRTPDYCASIWRRRGAGQPAQPLADRKIWVSRRCIPGTVARPRLVLGANPALPEAGSSPVSSHEGCSARRWRLRQQ